MLIRATILIQTPAPPRRPTGRHSAPIQLLARRQRPAEVVGEGLGFHVVVVLEVRVGDGDAGAAGAGPGGDGEVGGRVDVGAGGELGAGGAGEGEGEEDGLHCGGGSWVCGSGSNDEHMD